MNVIKKKGTVVLYKECEQFGVKELETNLDICEKSIYIQTVKEEFEHYWRKKYSCKVTQNTSIFKNFPGFFGWESVLRYE